MAHPMEVEAVRAIELLLTGDEPVSFYDARVVLNPMRRSRHEPSDALLLALMRLRDGGNATHGARFVLDEYLRGCARRHAEQRAFAEKPIKLKHSGRVARARVGATVTFHLVEDRAKGFRWELTSLQGPAKLERNKAKSEFGKAVLDLRLLKSGEVHVELVEHGPAPLEAASPTTFALRVVVEPQLNE